jgi:NAD+ diphosphatase
VLAAQLVDFPFRRTAHDRLSERRKDDTFLESAWSDPATRVIVMRGDKLPTRSGGGGLDLVPPAEAPDGERFLLGGADGTTVFLVLADPVDESADASPLLELRRLVDDLDDVGLSLAVHAVALAGWHRKHPHCAVCGAVTEVAEAGASRKCPACGTAHFPRTDPAVIMLVVDAADRCLLGHNSARAEGWFSTLAGFVEPGESPEGAVVREVFEETGIRVTDVTYAGSQPWPFPSSLMLGFFARATSVDVTVDGDEITEARWFTRDELRAGVEAGKLAVPTTISIAGALLTSWYGARLPTARQH